MQSQASEKKSNDSKTQFILLLFAHLCENSK